jgi:hypothetical protein
MPDFADPTVEGDRLDYHALNGALLLFTVSVDQPGVVSTVHGDATPARTAVAVLDGEHKGDTYADALVFPRALSASLRANTGKLVIGRLGQGVAKPGKNPPWTLTPATDAEKETGRKYLEYAAAQAVQDDEPPF